MSTTAVKSVATPTVVAALRDDLPSVAVLCQKYSKDKAGITAIVHETFGMLPPKSWSVVKLAAVLHGEFPGVRGKFAKHALTAVYQAKMEVAPTASWSGRVIAEKLASKTLPGLSSASSDKAAARAEYREKMGCEPCQSWTASVIRQRLADNKPPKASKSNGGLTGEACKKLLSAARKNGVTVPAYSKMTANELRSLVAELKLA